MGWGRPAPRVPGGERERGWRQAATVAAQGLQSSGGRFLPTMTTRSPATFSQRVSGRFT